jgi:hypothetical protein
MIIDVKKVPQADITAYSIRNFKNGFANCARRSLLRILTEKNSIGPLNSEEE